MTKKVHPLEGKTITNVFLTKDREEIKFILSDGTQVVATCDADCCSYTWIEDIINLNAVLNSPVLKVEDLDLPEEFCKKTKTENYEEEMQYYGLAIETVKGRFILAYRNSSNGYYGGWLHWNPPIKEGYQIEFYGGVYGQNSINHHESQWEELKGDN